LNRTHDRVHHRLSVTRARTSGRNRHTVQTELNLAPRKSNPVDPEAHETAEVKDRIRHLQKDWAQRWSEACPAMANKPCLAQGTTFTARDTRLSVIRVKQEYHITISAVSSRYYAESGHCKLLGTPCVEAASLSRLRRPGNEECVDDQVAQQYSSGNLGIRKSAPGPAYPTPKKKNSG
jgi:hypothetical protein